MNLKNFRVGYTDDFNHKAKNLRKKYPSFEADLRGLGASLAETPQQGTPIGKGCYKVRLAISSKMRGKFMVLSACKTAAAL